MKRFKKGNIVQLKGKRGVVVEDGNGSSTLILWEDWYEPLLTGNSRVELLQFSSNIMEKEIRDKAKAKGEKIEAIRNKKVGVA